MLTGGVQAPDPPRVRYSGSIMSYPLAGDTLDPIRLTIALCQIDSTTYHEGAVGDFLADFLAERGWAVEKSPVEQPEESATGSERRKIYFGNKRENTAPRFFTH